MNNLVEWSYALYLLLSVVLTIWVARTLHRNGRVFLIDAFAGRETLADSVNHLLVVGFYLINIGYVTLALKYGVKPRTLTEGIESLSTKIGFVLVVLGGMHFFNLAVFAHMRHRTERQNQWGRLNEPVMPPPMTPLATQIQMKRS